MGTRLEVKEKWNQHLSEIGHAHPSFQTRFELAKAVILSF